MTEDPEAVKQGDMILLRNGYCGTVKYIDESDRYGVELTQPFINGNDGRGKFQCKPRHGFFTRNYVSKLNPDGKFNVKDSNDIISFPTRTHLEEIKKQNTFLSSFGYIRDIHKARNDEFFTIIPDDVVQLCMKYNSCHPNLGDRVMLKTGETKRIWSIGYSTKTNTIHYGVHWHNKDNDLLNFITQQAIQDTIPKSIVNSLCEFEIGQNVIACHREAQVKFIGVVDGFEVIGVEFDGEHDIFQLHDGNGYFRCSRPYSGLFIMHGAVRATLEVELGRLSKYVDMCCSSDIATNLCGLRRIREITTSVPPDNQLCRKLTDSGMLQF